MERACGSRSTLSPISYLLSPHFLRNQIRTHIIQIQPQYLRHAVIFDAVKSANARGYDMVIADTAGRLHNKKGLMDELSKISRSVKKASPEASLEVLLVLDAITGQNAISQAEEFCKAANATGVVLTKLDGTPRGGCAVSVWENLGLPIRFIGVGEKIDDLMEFDAQTFVESLLPESALQKDEKKEEGESEA